MEIDSARREVDAYVVGWPGSNGARSGKAGHYPLSPKVDGEALADFLESGKFRALATRIIDGTRIDTIDGSAVAVINGDVRAAESELASRLMQLPDHEVDDHMVDDWLSGQGDFLEILSDGTLDDAVGRLGPAFTQAFQKEGIRILSMYGEPGELGHVGDTLLDEARRLFDRGCELYPCHIAALLKYRMLREAEARAWTEENGATSG